ncbi:hypothetical protein [Pusillimonas noertemannii]|uniref:hypothetical protein n=1 Tax=Pusillimonas noertemannii TaxID=305977 RepID=UPI0002FC03D4|nr:hypothetical protein [Pusillimonas noertemannii]
MFFHNSTLLLLAVLGVIFTFIGFGLRDRNLGLVLLGLGFLAIVYAVITKAIELFG